MDIVVDKLRQEPRQARRQRSPSALPSPPPYGIAAETELAALMTMRTAGGVNVMPAGEVCISTASNVLGMLLGANTSTTTVNGDRQREDPRALGREHQRNLPALHPLA